MSDRCNVAGAEAPRADVPSAAKRPLSESITALAPHPYSRDFPLLHRPADLCHGAVDGHRIGRRASRCSSLPLAQYPDITPPTVQVICSYPGANAQVVADTVAAPIEQQVNGVENMLYMSSQCTNDGAYMLTVTFALGTDLKLALVQVQNRVQLAMPQLPNQVQQQGVNIKKKTPNILLAVNLFSPDGRYDDLYLSNYAMLHVRDEVLRLPGVSDVTHPRRARLQHPGVARSGEAGRPQHDRQRRGRGRSGARIVRRFRGQIGQPPVGAGRQFQPILSALGRLVDARAVRRHRGQDRRPRRRTSS